jgi:bisphosphoglycerate-dependent phosphoglycerate mutase family 1
MEMGQEYIPVYKSWRLNERSYGCLVGKNKKECVKLFGAEQVKRWRRSWDEPPPPMEDDHEYHPAWDPRYRMVRIRYCCTCVFIYEHKYVNNFCYYLIRWWSKSPKASR